MTFGVFGNMLVIYIFGVRFKKPLSKPELLILFLGMVDLFVSLTNPTLYVYFTLTGYTRWDFGLAGCKILPAVAPISTSFSAAIILIMTIDRDRSIMAPFKEGFKKSSIYIALAVSFVLSCMAYINYSLNLSISAYGCGPETNPGYYISNISILLVSDLVFFSVFLTTSVRIFLRLRMNKKQPIKMGDIKSEDLRKKRSKRVIRLVFAMGLLFAVCTYPRDILHLAFNFSFLIPPTIKVTKTVQFLNSAFKVLHTANSSFNIFIYSSMNRKFRSELLLFFRRFGFSRTNLSKRVQRMVRYSAEVIGRQVKLDVPNSNSSVSLVSYTVNKNSPPKDRSTPLAETTSLSVSSMEVPSTVEKKLSIRSDRSRRLKIYNCD
ncbi:tachykinin-like peptides receptor 99D [Hydractinia symbiolongicarpus]|uniref:tachykinin-like peptides receptor 99D n=1 Tax=Hydractinia symbiolongicarpus TaxID=13093 RepID=UPI00254D0F2F|nr:tachykinin-like peptides receptor 99D [Hydractinia symbiolongicarpus]